MKLGVDFSEEHYGFDNYRQKENQFSSESVGKRGTDVEEPLLVFY